MDENNLKKMWIISIFIVLILFSMYLVFSKEKSLNNETNTSQEKYKIVKNYNDFYTVNSCIYRFLTYLQNSNTEALMKVLNGDYVQKNGITKDNVLNKISIDKENINFSSEKMYVEEINKNVNRFYVYGFLEKSIMDEFPEKSESYYIVILDKNKQVFSIEPYDGKLFR